MDLSHQAADPGVPTTTWGALEWWEKKQRFLDDGCWMVKWMLNGCLNGCLMDMGWMFHEFLVMCHGFSMIFNAVLTIL